MITVYHLENSRSLRILWLLEELGVPYEIERFERDPKTQRAPKSLRAIHPLGKSPAIRDGDLTLIESGAIVEYVLERYGEGRLVPRSDSEEFARYLQWLHFAEGSAVFPLLLDLFLGMSGAGEDSPLAGFVRRELSAQLSFLDDELAERDYFGGSAFTAADVMMAFPLEFAARRDHLTPYGNLRAYVARIQARPAYERARKAAD